MRSLIIPIFVAMIVAVAVIPEISDAEGMKPANEPTDVAILHYYWGSQINQIETYYVIPNLPIGTQNIAELTWPDGHWVRMDTGEVVTEETVFAPGTYMIKAYSNIPTPWGDDTPSSSGPDNTLAVTAIVLSVIAIITGATAIYVVLRRK